MKAAPGRDDEMGPADNIARERYNAMIREKYGATGRLVDIAAAELLKMVATNSPVA